MKPIVVKKSRGLKGTLSVPGDKSITHRAIILGSLGCGTAVVRGYLPSDDCLRTAQAFRRLGISIKEEKDQLTIIGKGLRGLSDPGGDLDLGNSGTGLRLLTGVLAGQDLVAVLTGDESLRSRPMLRVVAPLRRMGAKIKGPSRGKFAPLEIHGRRLKGIHYVMPAASAQVKSALLLAGLLAEGPTAVTEPLPTRDHTERLFRHMGIPLKTENQEGLKTLRLEPAGEFEGRDIEIPGDLSSAAFFIVAASIIPNSELMIRNVGVNPTRTGLLELLSDMGAEIKQENPREVSGEPVADLSVCSRPLKGIQVPPEMVPRTIDEFPVLCVAAAAAEGETEIRGAEELRVKESDRIRTIAQELSRMGADVKELPDGMVIRGGKELRGARCRSHGDHRIAMAMTVAGLAASGETTVEGAEWVDTSFPGFQRLLESVAA